MEIATDNIYENYDVTRGTFEKETTDCNATRIQSSELTGADGVTIRISRAAAVRLILLCVLLLTAVIVLCVLFTRERQQLISKNENLTRERDQLKQEKSDLQRCLDGWIYYQSSLYFISSELKSWNESRRYCRDRGADLIIINNTTEGEFVNRISGNISGNTGVWIGLSEVDGRWKWVDGSAPNSESWVSPDGQNCIRSYYSLWYYDLCDRVYRWICEKSILPNVLP